MNRRRKQIAMLLACTTAIGTCSLSCEEKKEKLLFADDWPGHEMIIPWDNIETTMVTTTATATTTAKVTTPVTTQKTFEVTTSAASTNEQIFTTNTTTAYIAEVSVVATTGVEAAKAEASVVPEVTQSIDAVPAANPTAEIENIVQTTDFTLDVVPTTTMTVSRSYHSGWEAQSYYVEYGDCLSTIAEKFNCSEESIKNTNASIYDWNFIMPGDCIIIPNANTVQTYYNNGYIVECGDCLSLIADKLGCYPEDLVYANPSVDWDYIQPGESLVVPSSFVELNGFYDDNSEYELVETLQAENELLFEDNNVEIIAEVEVTTVPEIIPVETTSMETAVIETTSIEVPVVETTSETTSSKTTSTVTTTTQLTENQTETNATESEGNVTAISQNEVKIPNTGNAENSDNHILNEVTNDMPRRRFGYYYGKVTSNDYNSLKNIEHSCSDINGYIVPAYSTFSWLEDIGPCEEGYEIAYVLDDSYTPTEEEPLPKDRGGGICVTATCLRNAAEAVVGPENIIEAHDHSKDGIPIDMSYAQIGHQATIDYPNTDFKFYNPNEYSLKIYAYFSWYTNMCYVGISPKLE